MDTKWNRTSEKGKGFLSLAAFMLGMSLLAGSLLGAGKLALQTPGDMEWWRGSWQDTTAFKQNVSWYLQKFLGFAGDVEWYDRSLMKEKEPLLPGGGLGMDDTWASETPAAEAALAAPAAENDHSVAVIYTGPAKRSDAAFQKDTNVLYKIFGGNGSGISYSNTSEYWENLPEDYDFLLTYRDGTVTIQKNDEEVDVYGDGIYDSAEQWYVPGYDNFKAPDAMQDIQIHIAVRDTPIRLYGEGYYQSSQMYSLYREYQAFRDAAWRLAVMLGASLVCLLAAHRLRDYRGLACRAVAKLTGYIPAELWLVLVLGFAAFHVFLIEGHYWLGEVIYLFFTKEQHLALLTGLLLALWPTTPLFCLGWTLWLIRNGRRYIPPEKRRGLLRALRARDLKRPVQKRLRRNAFAGVFAMVVLAVFLLPVVFRLLPRLLNGDYYFTWWYFVGAFALVGFLLLLLAMIVSAIQSLHLAKDIGLLIAHITAIREGDLTTSLALPKDADLYRAAEELSSIQSGLEKALQERTQSERMKVELISNVSHDLKTPLTSVLSYAALLEEEDLPGPAGDYARIILEKAKRLDTMVQDVFSISKAASGQLKLTPERLDLGKLLRQTLADMEDAIEKSGLTLKVDLPEEPVEIVADGARLYRVFQNLLQNALQYSLPGSRVYLTLKTAEGRAEAAVRNTSAAEIPAGVDFTARFVRGDESRTDGGSGLGLSIAKTFTESCGGTFVVETLADLFTAKVSFPLA